MEYGFCIFMITILSMLAFTGTYSESRNCGFDRKSAISIGLLVAFSCLVIGICLMLICNGEL